jgi:hypothetical protein
MLESTHFRAYNASKEWPKMNSTMKISIGFTVFHGCECATARDFITCGGYQTVGLHLEDFCARLGLNPDLSIELTSTPNAAALITMVDDAVYDGAKVLLVPVHAITGATWMGFKNGTGPLEINL